MQKIKTKTWPLIILCLMMIIFSAIKNTPLAINPLLSFWASVLIFVVCILNWLYKDAKEYHVQVSWFLKIAVALFAFIGVPYYLFKTRKLKAFLSLLYIVIAFFIMVLTTGFLHIIINLFF